MTTSLAGRVSKWLKDADCKSALAFVGSNPTPTVLPTYRFSQHEEKKPTNKWVFIFGGINILLQTLDNYPNSLLIVAKLTTGSLFYGVITVILSYLLAHYYSSSLFGFYHTGRDGGQLWAPHQTVLLRT